MTDQGRWQLQTREVIRAISELSAEAEFSVVYYGSRVTAFREQTIKATPSGKAAGIQFVKSRNPNGDTCIGEGTTKALQIVRRSASAHRAVIVTSDGRPDVCATGNLATPAEQQRILQQTVSANPGRGVIVHTIFVGRSGERQAIEFMRHLADAHGGTFRLVSQ
jgi:Mg-chelatase subunit ChlD